MSWYLGQYVSGMHTINVTRSDDDGLMDDYQFHLTILALFL